MRTLLAAMAATFALLVATATAAAIEIRPAGRVTSTSSGSITFTADQGSFTCRLTLTGTIASRTTGTMGRREPATNPRLGNYSEGTPRECVGGEMTLSFPAGSWTAYLERWEGSTRALMYILGADFLITSLLSRCLYEGAVSLRYDEATGAAAITGITVLRQIALTVCPTNPSIAGTLNSTAEGGIFGFGPKLTAEPGQLEYGGQIRPQRVTFRNNWLTQLVVEALDWEPTGSETGWIVEELNCGVVRSGESCSITIRSKAESIRATIHLKESILTSPFEVGRVTLNP
jgi:hypothetical protein